MVKRPLALHADDLAELRRGPVLDARVAGRVRGPAHDDAGGVRARVREPDGINFGLKEKKRDERHASLTPTG